MTQLQPPATPSTGGEPLDRDLYCIECGYNLRGLSGDPVRCPECAYMNPVAVIEVPAKAIRMQLERMETGPATCVGVLLIGVPLSVPFGAILYSGLVHGGRMGIESICLAVALTVFVVQWWISCFAFRRSCKARPGWVTAFLAYHLWAFLAIGLVLALSISAYKGIGALLGKISSESVFFRYVVGGSVVLTWGLVTYFAVTRIYRRIRRSLDPLQREVAVEITREKIRKRQAGKRGVLESLLGR